MNKNTYKLVCLDFLVHGFDDSGKKKKKKENSDSVLSMYNVDRASHDADIIPLLKILLFIFELLESFKLF